MVEAGIETIHTFSTVTTLMLVIANNTNYVTKIFSCTLKNMGRPGYKASVQVYIHGSVVVRLSYFPKYYLVHH